MRIVHFSIVLVLSLSLATNVFANTQAIQIVDEIPAKVIIHPAIKPANNQKLMAASTTRAAEPTAEKRILLQHMVLSPAEQEALAENMLTQEKATQEIIKANPSIFQTAVTLGMNNVPVLDQGVHGTCATFASTGIVDAAY